MMWFNYMATSGVLIHYTDLNGIDRTYQTNFSSPEDIVKTVAMLGLAYELAPAIQQQLLRTYNNESIKFTKGE